MIRVFKMQKHLQKSQLMLLIIIGLFTFCISYSQNSILKTEIIPLNRLNITFQQFPIKYKTELSDDKKIITISLEGNYLLKDTAFDSNGIIQNVSIKTSNSISTVIINLNERRGYTVATLPYSKTLFIDVFQWERLTYGEDKFRTALLGLEYSFSINSAMDMIAAIKEKVELSPTILGINLITSGNYKSAFKVLRYAEIIGDTTFADIYGGLADLYQFQSNNIESENYKKKFSFKTQSSFSSYLSNYNSSTDEEILPKLQFIDSLIAQFESSKIDSTQISKQDTILISQTQIEEKTEEPFSKSIFIYIILFLLVLIFALVYLYYQWKNKKIQEIINKNKIKYPSDISKINESKKPSNPKIANYYKKQEEIQKEILDSKTEPNIKKIKEEEAKKSTLKDIMHKIQNEEQIKNEQIANISPIIEEKSVPENMSAKVEIAINIAKEQQKIKQQSLEDFNSLNIPTDKEKLLEISKKLGIELSGFDIKKQINNIMNNDKELEKLKNKFTSPSE